MGYEVLDAEGADVRLPSGDLSPQHVVPIDTLAGPQEALDEGRAAARGRLRRPAGGPRRLPGWLPGWLARWLAGRLAGGLLGGPRSVGAAAAVAALVLGVVAGGSWSAHLQAQDRVRARRGQLQALAMVTSIDTVGEDRGRTDRPFADVTVRVVNAGPLPVEVVLSPRGTLPTLTTPVVRDLGGAHTVPAGDVLSVSVRLAVDCAGVVRQPRQVWVPVRTADGTVHRLTARGDALDSGLHFGQAPCADPGAQSLTTELLGTISHPVLRLKNTSSRTLSVRLDLEQSPFVAQTTNFSVLRLTPALPQTITAGGQLDLAVLLTPWACPAGLSQVLSSQLSPYVVLRAGSPDGDVLAQEAVGVDLSTLWGAALARDCS